MTARRWRGRSHGGGVGHALVHAFARYGGLWLCYGMLIPPTTWYFIRDTRARRTTMSYWRRVRPSLGRWGAAVMTWRHFFSFARNLADRFLVGVDPDSLRFENRGQRRMEAAMRHPQGCIVLSAHLGNWELAGRWLTRHRHGVINIVMLQDEDPRVREQMTKAMGAHPFGIIDLRDPFGASLQIAAALRRGETCCMLGDRTAGSDVNAISVPFFGRPARFPTGPFVAAAATGALIVPVFSVKSGLRTYFIAADEPWTLSFSSRARRREELTAVVARWAERLERVVRRHPLQWQNFYDFWAE
ncbi:MAG: lysophospholipid acyltransferase family protein [Planctomycetes bacterium]|nr:lysophospholipid acyltransferase family protein [Planctomycetota bacterium]